MDLPSLNTSYFGSIQHIAFCVWLISLSMLLNVLVFHTFLCLNNISLYVYTIFCISNHALINIWVVSTFWLLWIMLWGTLVYKDLFEPLFSIPLGVYLEVDLLDHMIILCLTFWETLETFKEYKSQRPTCFRILSFSNLNEKYQLDSGKKEKVIGDSDVSRLGEGVDMGARWQWAGQWMEVNR